MRQMKKTVLALVLLLALLLPVMLSSCNGNKTPAGPVKAKATNVYRAKKLDMEAIMPEEEKESGSSYIQNMYYAGGKIYILKQYYEWENDKTTNTVYTMSESGELLDQWVLDVQAPVREDWDLEAEGSHYGRSINHILFHESGRMLVQVYSWYSGEIGYEESSALMLLDLQGNMLASRPLTDLVDPEEAGDYVYCNQVMFIDGDRVLANVNDTLMVLNGNLEKQYEVDPGTGWIQNMAMLGGQIYLSIYDDSIQSDNYADYEKLYVLDPDTRSLTLSEHQLPGMIEFYNVQSGPGYDLYYKDWNTGIYGYSFGDAEPTELFNYINSDMTSDEVNTMVVIDADTFLCTGYDPLTYEQHLILLTRVPEEELVEEIIIRLGCIDVPYDLRNAIIRFNKESEQYRITVDDYSRFAGENYDYEPCYTRLNNDIISGNVPDMMLLNSEMPVQSYFKKGLFYDLNLYFESDSSINRSDYLENILDALEYDGKLYRITPSFSVSTLVGKKALLGDRTGWTVEEMMAFFAEHEGVRPFFDMTKEQALRWCCGNVINDFIDPVTGRCYFDSQRFRDLLTFVNSCSEKSVWDEYDWETDGDDLFNDEQTTYREGTTLLKMMTIYSFTDMFYEKRYSFGEEMTAIGFPASEGNGSIIRPSMQLAISARSAARDGAWEFIKVIMGEEYAENLYELPVNAAALDRMAADAMPKETEPADTEKPIDPPMDMPEDTPIELPVPETDPFDDIPVDSIIGEEQPELGVQTEPVADPAELAATDIMLPVPEPGIDEYPHMDQMTEEEVNDMVAFLKSLHVVESSNDKVFAVILEECAPFFAGQKSLDQTVKIIQDKVSIMVNE